MIAAAYAQPAQPEDAEAVQFGQYGTPGMLDMPIATPAPDAQLTLTTSHFGGTTRNTLAFQVAPILSGSFRYSNLRGQDGSSYDLWDRSFDLQFNITKESESWPAIAVGIRDMLGTGVYSSEYVAASKQVLPGLTLTGGLGWGRLGSHNGFKNPLSIFGSGFETRPQISTQNGGTFNSNVWFRGDAALFGGLNWNATERLTLTAEYSSDAYLEEVKQGVSDWVSPFNFGLSYKVSRGVDLSAFYMNGSELGLRLSLAVNPKNPPLGPTPYAAPEPVAVRTSRIQQSGLLVEPKDEHKLVGIEEKVERELRLDGIFLESMMLAPGVVEVEIRNARHRSFAQATGRTARILSRTMPDSVEDFRITLVAKGMPAAVVVISRTDLEELEHAPDGAWQSWVRSDLENPPLAFTNSIPINAKPKFDWLVGPYLDMEFFDPDNPLRADLGVQAWAQYDFGNALFLSGAVRKKIFGNLDTSIRESDSVLPHVRSDNALYNKYGDPALEYLTIEKFARPGPDLYARATAGYLEKMFAGVSAELLWKPMEQDFGLGVELNYAKQREYDQGFGLAHYDVFTGHVSTYFGVGENYNVQLDVGRYLAQDWGGTLTIGREFRNGWKVAAFATITDVSFDDFGEGSFDKGIRITVPIGWVSGRQTRDTYTTTIRPILRDGGARLNVRNRLYDVVAPLHRNALEQEWGLFWR